MAPKQDLSTPKCPAEERAWLLMHQTRSRRKKSLIEGFNKQFPARESADILMRAAHVRKDHKAHSRLQDLARQFPWYKDPPKEGERGFESMKKIEKQNEARDRMKNKFSHSKANPTDEAVGTGAAGPEIS